MKRIIVLLVLLVWVGTYAGCSGGGSTESSTPSDNSGTVHDASLAVGKTVYLQTGDAEIPYLAVCPDGSYFSYSAPQSDGTLDVTYTTPDGESIWVQGTEGGELVQAVFGDYVFLFNDQDSFIDAAVTDSVGSFNYYQSIPKTSSVNSLSLSSVENATARTVSKTVSEGNTLGMLQTTNAFFGKLESAFTAFPPGTTPSLGGIVVAIGSSLKTDVYSAAINILASDSQVNGVQTEESKIIADVAGILMSHATCVSGSYSGCISNVLTTTKAVAELTGLVLNEIAESKLRDEMFNTLKLRMTDNDLDGKSEVEGDCNDNDPTIYRGAPEICDDGIDQNCDGANPTTDMCGTCDIDPLNDCVQDCAGVWGGSAAIDNCGSCNPDPNFDCKIDCNGDFNGTAFYNGCGVCVGGNSPNNEPCIKDCNGDPNGTAKENACGVCVGGNSSLVDDCAIDCMEVPGGTATYNTCGVCVGGTSPNVDDPSCNDVYTLTVGCDDRCELYLDGSLYANIVHSSPIIDRDITGLLEVPRTLRIVSYDNNNGYCWSAGVYFKKNGVELQRIYQTYCDWAQCSPCSNQVFEGSMTITK